MNLELQISTVYSLGYFFSSCQYELNVPEHYGQFISPLVNCEFPKEAIKLYPSLIFVLTYFIRDEPTQSQVR